MTIPASVDETNQEVSDAKDTQSSLISLRPAQFQEFPHDSCEQVYRQQCSDNSNFMLYMEEHERPQARLVASLLQAIDDHRKKKHGNSNELREIIDAMIERGYSQSPYKYRLLKLLINLDLYDAGEIPDYVLNDFIAAVTKLILRFPA